MKKAAVHLTIFLLAIQLLSGIAIEGAAAVGYSGGGDFTPSYASDRVDYFGYRLSFRLSDGVEVFSVRGSFWLQFSYPTDPTTEQPKRRHTMYINLGFYYGKTPLGRSVVRTISAEMAAFFPKWIDSAGYPHDLYQDTSMFMIDNLIPDGARVFTGMRIDEHSLSRYMPCFGGTFVFSELKFVMDDGSEIDIGTIEIELVKYSNELDPRAELISAPATVTYTSDADILTAVAEGTGPIIYAIDSAFAAILWIIGGTLVILGYLHIKGRVNLPLNRLRKGIQKEPNSTDFRC
ncbi:MAG: hypothetical protein ACFFAY_03920 [Promethearchaeota archaeon]